MKRILYSLILAGLLGSAAPVGGSPLANPGLCLPPARLALGASYHLGGYTLTGDELPAIFNRFHARASYSPVQFVNFGIDLGTMGIEVNGIDSLGIFHGNYGFSGGGHLKLMTPYFANEYLALLAIIGGTWFSSENDHGARYGGVDGNGSAGILVRIPEFGAISAGVNVYYIHGENKAYNKNTTGFYSNVNNVRGWMAFDFIPTFKGAVKGKPYFSFEFTLSPDVDTGEAVPIEEISFTFSVGWISPRLYGEDFEDIQ